MDWNDCELVERIPGKKAFRLLQGTRIPANQIVEEHELGSPIEEIVENYPSLTHDNIRHLIAFTERKSQLVRCFADQGFPLRQAAGCGNLKAWIGTEL